MRFNTMAMLLRLGPRRIAQFFAHLPNFLRLFWRLLKDPRVPVRPKLLLLLILAYLLIPADLLPDVFLVLGQIDDLIIVYFGLRLFLRLCPKEVVREHVEAIAAGR